MGLLLVAASGAEQVEPVLERPAPVVNLVPAISPALSFPLTPVLPPTANAEVELAAEPPALPQTTVLAQPSFQGAATPGLTQVINSPTQSKEAGPQDASSGWLSGAQMFDKALDNGGAPLSVFMAAQETTPASKAYAQAMRNASWEGWAAHRAAVADAAQALLTQKGVKASRLSYPSGPGSYEGVQVAAEPGISPLNDLAYELKRSLGTTLDYIPERTAGAAASYNSRENRLMLAGLDRPDFYLALLHEARHAWYARALREGRIMLYHFSIVAFPHRRVAPNAESYTSYFSFEELSNHPKTLKHMITEHAKLSGDAAAFMESKTLERAYQYVDLLRSTDYILSQIRRYDEGKKLELRRVTAEQAQLMGLDVVPGLDYFALALPQGELYWPVPQRQSNLLGFKSMKGRKDEALAALRLRTRLLGEMLTDSVDPAKAYLDAVRGKDWPAAGRAADRLVAAARRAESGWHATPGP